MRGLLRARNGPFFVKIKVKKMNVINKKIKLPNGKEISIETGKLAKQADGSVVVRMGDTMFSNSSS